MATQSGCDGVRWGCGEVVVESRWGSDGLALRSWWGRDEVAVRSRRGRGESFKLGSARLTNMATRQNNDETPGIVYTVGALKYYCTWCNRQKIVLFDYSQN